MCALPPPARPAPDADAQKPREEPSGLPSMQSETSQGEFADEMSSFALRTALPPSLFVYALALLTHVFE